MKASVCMASFNRDPVVLRQVLDSICNQMFSCELEVIVADDGSDYGAPEVCKDYPVIYRRVERAAIPRNPAMARNVAYRAATGDIIIAQSDDVVHKSEGAIATLCRLVEDNPRSFVLATVYGCNRDGVPDGVYTGTWRSLGKRRHKPYFFLGALRRTDVYDIGGNDEDFTTSNGQSWEDVWFAQCLIDGLGLTPIYTTEVVGYHLWHESLVEDKRYAINRRLAYRKRLKAQETGVWCASGGPWEQSSE